MASHLLCLQNVSFRAARTYSSSATGTHGLLAKAAIIEVERKKFSPNARFHAVFGESKVGEPFLLSTNDECKQDSPPSSGLSFFRLPGKLIRDVYYDLNDQLNQKGIWVRQRASEEVSKTDVAKDSKDELNGEWEAKIRLSGDYVNSQFHELEGKIQIDRVLAHRLPGIALEELSVMADLETRRKTWVVHESGRAANRDTGEISVVLDEITDSSAAAMDSKPFKHCVGEVEMTQKLGVQGMTPMQRQVAAWTMDAAIEAFIGRHERLSLTSPVPKGKLSAYFDWKRSSDSSADHL